MHLGALALSCKLGSAWCPLHSLIYRAASRFSSLVCLGVALRPGHGLAQARGMFGRRIRCCCWMPGMAIPAGAAAAAAGSGGSSSSRGTPVLGPCWVSLPSSSPKCSGFRGWNAWPHIAVSTGLLFHSVKSWVFCYLDIFLTSPETLRALIYYLHSFPVSFGWSYNSHFVSEKISTSSLKVPSVVYCIFWGTEN